MRYVEQHPVCPGGGAARCAAARRTRGPQGQAALPPAAAAKAASGHAAAPVDAAAQRSFDEARRALAAGQTAEAERRFLALTQSNPELGGPHASLGLIYQQAGKPAEAVRQFEAAVKASPQQPAYLNQLGVAYRQQGQFDKAREAYEKAIALAPDHAAADAQPGHPERPVPGRPARALELYERYLLLTPAGDATVSKWVVDLKNRKPQTLAAKGKS